MTTLIDAAFLRGSFDIHEDIIDSRLTGNIGAASRRLRKWTTDELYQSMRVASESSDEKQDFKLAEANLAMHFAVLGLNTPITSKGIIKTSKAKDTAVLTYFTPPEIADIARMYLEQAEEIIRPYVEYVEPSGVEIGL